MKKKYTSPDFSLSAMSSYTTIADDTDWVISRGEIVPDTDAIDEGLLE